MPRKTTFFPCACSCFQLFSRSGISSLQGSHQEAQKFRTIALPLKSASESGLFSLEGLKVASEKPGAGWPIRGSDTDLEGTGVSNYVRMRASNPTLSRLTPQKISTFRLRFFARPGA